MKIRRFNENSDEFNILEDVAQEYIDKYHLFDSTNILWMNDGHHWGSYKIFNHQQKKLYIWVLKDKVDEEEFYQDMNKLSVRLKSMGRENIIDKIDKKFVFGYSITLQTKEDIWKSLWDEKNED